jgi:alcohol dehydrogenase
VSDGLDNAVEALILRVEALMNAAGIPRSLLEAGVMPELIPILAQEAARQWTVNFNPRPMGAADFESLYRAALEPRV